MDEKINFETIIKKAKIDASKDGNYTVSNIIYHIKETLLTIEEDGDDFNVNEKELKKRLTLDLLNEIENNDWN